MREESLFAERESAWCDFQAADNAIHFGNAFDGAVFGVLAGGANQFIESVWSS